MGQVLARPVADPLTGEIVAEEGVKLTRELAEKIERLGVREVYLTVEEKEVKVFSNGMVNLDDFVSFKGLDIGVKEKVSFQVLRQILESCEDEASIKEEIGKRYAELVPNHITLDDIFASINYLTCIEKGIGVTDDIAVSYTHLDGYKRQATGSSVYSARPSMPVRIRISMWKPGA